MRPPPTPPESSTTELSTRNKAAWASGAIADVFMANSFSYLALPIYNLALKVDPVFLGWAMGLPRIWDAFADTFAGNISDNTRSRWGRRRPYIFFGALLSGLFFALIWMPPAKASPQVIGIYFLIVSFLYYTFYALFTVPWGAMGLELTDDYNERTNVQAWKNAMQAGGGLFLGTLWWLSLRLGANEVEGARWVGLIFGIVIAGAGVLPALLVRERHAHTSQEKIRFLKAARETFGNPAFLSIAGFTLCIIFGIFVINSFSLYINIIHVFGGDKGGVATLNMIINGAFQAFSLAITPVVAIVAKRAGKCRTLIGGMLLVMCGFLSSWWTYTPAAPYLQVVSLLLISPGLSCLWIIGPSMLADVCDYDETKTGLRREGMYSACYAWTVKAGISLTLVLGGYMLQWAGYDAMREAHQAAGVVERIRLLYMTVPAFMSLLGILCVVLYPLNDRRLAEIRKQLAAKSPHLD